MDVDRFPIRAVSVIPDSAANLPASNNIIVTGIPNLGAASPGCPSRSAGCICRRGVINSSSPSPVRKSTCRIKAGH